MASGKGEYLLAEDLSALKHHHQFVRDDERDRKDMSNSWEVRMARKYYNKLYKEYALADLSLYREGKIGLRWRTEHEVVIGKGQFICGSIPCDERAELRVYELPFRYGENGETKHELVKIRLCGVCAPKIFYKKLQAMQKKRDGRSSEGGLSGEVGLSAAPHTDVNAVSKRPRHK